MQIGSRVRFVADSRNGDWKKGQYAVIEKVLALPPQNTTGLYIARFNDRKVWVTEKDVEPVYQLTIWDELLVHGFQATSEASSDKL